MIARTPEKFRETGVDVRVDTRVEEIDGKAGEVRLADGARLSYDILVLGTGTTPLMPRIPGEDRKGVFTLKKFTDAVRIKAWLREIPCRKAIIVGAGFIGMEMCEAIRVNFSQRTPRDGVYAVGDCCESFHRVSGRWVNIPLGDIANKQGRVAGRNIGGGLMIFPWIVGAQAVGKAGAVSRINTLSAALWTGLTIDDVGWLDLAYAPPFSESWDPIHVAAQTLRRQI